MSIGTAYIGNGTDLKQISGICKVPRMTLAEYNALNVKPEFWVRTDLSTNLLMCGNDVIGSVGLCTSESIATVVTNPTTVSISNGSHFMLDGVRYKATANISAGGNIQVGTNCVVESVEDSFDSKVGGWTYLGEKTGTAEHSLPTGWKELLLQVYANSANLVTYHIYNTQTDSYTNTSLGNYGTSYAVGQISRTKARISTVNWGGSDVTSSAKLYAYYR